MNNFVFQRRNPARLLFIKIAIEVDPVVVNAVVESLQLSAPSLQRHWLQTKLREMSNQTSTVNDDWKRDIIEHLANAVTLQVAANAQVALVNATSYIAQQCAYAHDVYGQEARIASLLTRFKTSPAFGALLNSVLKPVILTDGTMVIPIVASKDVSTAISNLKSINPTNLGFNSPIKQAVFQDYPENALSVGSTNDAAHIQTLVTDSLSSGDYMDWNAEWTDDVVSSGVLAKRLYKVSGAVEYTTDGKFVNVDKLKIYSLPHGVDGKSISSTNDVTTLAVNTQDVINWWFNAFRITSSSPFKSNREKGGK